MARSWRLTKAAWWTVRHDRTLLVLGIAAGLTTMAMVAAVFWLSGEFDTDPHVSQASLLLWMVIAAWPLAFLAVLFDTAMVAAGRAALAGDHLSLRASLAVARRHLPALVAWSLISAVIGTALQVIGERVPFAGRLLQWLGSAAWGLATMFAVPVIVLEHQGPLAAARRSARLARERWGEGILGNVAIGAWAIIPSLAGGALIGAGIAMGDQATHVALVAAGLLVFALTFALSQATSNLFAVALYRYATDETATPAGRIPREDLADPPVKRRKRV